MLAIENRSDWPIHISTNIKWHENEENWYRLKEFDLNPGENTGPLAFCYKTRWEPSFSFDNITDSFITFSTVADGKEIQKTWRYDSSGEKNFYYGSSYSISERTIDGEPYYDYCFVIDQDMVESWAEIWI